MSQGPSIPPGLAYAAQPLPWLVTSGQPEQEHFRELAEARFKTVVDLRMPGEPRGFDEPTAVREAGLEYVSLPVMEEILIDESFDRFREVMRDLTKRPVLLHCTTANRVGALLLPYLILDEGRSPDDALQIARRVGLRSPYLAAIALDYAARAGRKAAS